MAKIIFFSGLDGAGKSTQIDILKNHYCRIKIKRCIIFGLEGGIPLDFKCLKTILRRSLKNKLPRAGKSTLKEKNLLLIR